jgi:hypothetical protein
VDLFALEPLEAAAVASEGFGVLYKHLTEPRGHQRPTRVHLLTVEFGQCALEQAVHGGVRQIVAGGLEGSEQPQDGRPTPDGKTGWMPIGPDDADVADELTQIVQAWWGTARR